MSLHTQSLSPTDSTTGFYSFYMFQLRIAAIFRELQMLKHVQRVTQVVRHKGKTHINIIP